MRSGRSSFDDRRAVLRLDVEPSPSRSNRGHSRPRLGLLPPRYAFVLHGDVRDHFTRCPRCSARTRLRKLALVIHVEHPAGAHLMMLGKTCRLCVVCEVLIAHEQEVTPLLVASGIATSIAAPNYLVLGIAAARVWRSGIARGVSLEAFRESMTDFNEYLRVNVAPGGWYRDGDDSASKGPIQRRRFAPQPVGASDW